MFRKKCYSIVGLILSISLFLAGCGSREDTDNAILLPNGEEIGQSISIAESGSWSGEGGCYKMEPLEQGASFNDLLVYGNDIYSTVTDQENETMSMELLKGAVSIYRTPFIECITADSSGIWLLADVTDYSKKSNREYHLVRLDTNGQVLLEKDISEPLEGSYPVDMLADSQGRPAILMNQSVLLFDSDGSLLDNVSLETSGSALALGGDGNLYAVLHLPGSQASASGSTDALSVGSSASAAGSSVFRLDMDAMAAEYVTEYEGYRICSGNEDYLFTLLNQDGLYGAASAGAEPAPIALWDELGLAFSSPREVQWMSDGRFLLIDRMLPAILSPAEPSELKTKTLLTIAAFTSFSSLGSLVSDFNISNEDYIIKLIDYSKDDTVFISDAIRALNMDILAGKSPDMLDMSYIPQSYYTDKGLLADLSVYLENDSEVSPKDFLLLDKLKTGSSLYYVPCYYYLESAVGLESIFGNSKGISLDDYMELQTRYPGEIMYNVTRSGFLSTQAYRYAADCVDWESGTCDFESEEFIKILNSTMQLRENPEPENPAELDYTPGEKRLAEGTLILCYQYIDSILTMAEAEEAAGEPLSFIGLPTPNGNGGTRLEPSGLVGIFSNGNADASWEFVKYMLTVGAENTAAYGITVNKHLLEEQIAEALSPSDDAEYKTPFDEADVAEFYELLENSVYYGNASREIVNIILEEASAMFAGAKSPEETAHVIQSRVSILVAE